MRALWEEGESDMVLWMLKEEVEVRPGSRRPIAADAGCHLNLRSALGSETGGSGHNVWGILNGFERPVRISFPLTWNDDQSSKSSMAVTASPCMFGST